jgi:tetratricopeptide (TPR) repeat protein
MAKKKKVSLPVTQENSAQVQQLLENYHQVASDLHTSKDQEQAEAALTAINTMSEGTQMALLKALSKEQHTDAADVLAAINALSPIKSVRKEARRSLIQLQGARIYPQWEPPVQQPLAVQTTTTPLQFWKGSVTDSLESGEVQLLLCWEVASDSKEVRILAFLLDFWQDGVKDFFTRIENKRGLDNLITQMSAMHGVKTKDCSLAEGRRLLLDALAANKRHGTTPHWDYRNNLSLVNRLILEVPGLDEEEEADLEDTEEDEEDVDLHDLDPQDVVITFIESWANGDYDIAYRLLTSDSPLRQGLSEEEWIDRRDAWSDEANPGDLEPGFIHEREPQKSRLWLPFGMTRSSNNKEIEAGWSIEMAETPLSDTLPELPKATAIYEETDRHWFWISYTLTQEQDEWRIQSMIDEGTNAQSLPVEELQEGIQELDKYLEEFRKKHNLADIQQLTEAETQHYAGEIFWRMERAVAYIDALIKKTPLDRALYEEASARMLVFNKLERCVVYVEPLAREFEEERGLYLRRLAEVQRRLSQKYFDLEDDERGIRFQELAEEALNESLTVEDSTEAHISLAEMFIEDDRLDEAEEHLLQAKAMTTDSSDEAHIEMHLGEIAMEREQYEAALHHYQRVAELEPDYPDSWVDLAKAYERLNNLEEAEANYRHAIELEPDDEDLYYALSKMYSDNGWPEKAIGAIVDGLSANPDSAILNVYLASMYLENMDYRQAEIFLDRAEQLDPELEAIPMFRYTLNFLKKSQQAPIGKLSQPSKKKKKR